jgi:hypothetical protein
MELAHVRYYDADLKIFPIVTTYQELMVMFEKYINTKVVHMFIAYSGFSEPYQPITQWESYATSTQPQPDQSQQTAHNRLRIVIYEIHYLRMNMLA